MDEDYSQLEDFPEEPKWWEPVWWAISRFFDNWVYPAHYLKNWLFHRYDIVKLNELKRYEYCDVDTRMLYANMELIRFFIEKEKPEEHVVWYKDDDGVDSGPKYGECKDWDVLYPEYKDKYIMDIIKEIYNWWTVELVRKEEECSYLLDFCCKYCWGKMKSKKLEGEMYQMVWDRSTCPTGLKYFDDKDIRWDIIDKYVDGDRKHVLEERFLGDKMHELEREIEKEKQKYLHLCIEVRPYLWT